MSSTATSGIWNIINLRFCGGENGGNDMENEKSTKRAILAAEACEGIYITAAKEQGVYVEQKPPKPPILPPQYSMDNDK